MALGKVVTAKGRRLDFAELMRKSRKPIQTPNVKGTTTRQTPPAKQLRARGHVASMNGVKMPEKPKVTPAANSGTGPAHHLEEKTLADYTGVTIDEAKHLKQPPANATQTANDRLVQILGNDMARSKGKNPGRR